MGGKHKILPQIFPLFPKDIDCFVDLFAGGANVGINSNADRIVLNDNLVYLIDIYEVLRDNTKDDTIKTIYDTIKEYDLSLDNADGYKELRERYNQIKRPMDLLVLSFFSFSHQIRFNGQHKFNTPFGRNRSRYNDTTENNLTAFIDALQKKSVALSKKSFDDFDFSALTESDFVYCDPPYLITTGTYNDGKRGFTGWGREQEQALLDALDSLDKRRIKFALSNVLTHKGKTNELLQDWVQTKGHKVNEVAKNYANSSYHTKDRDKKSTREVLITNY
ncbi:Dam family site-specific DNA-(adenine-N6)-methyltransferase [Candidatus Saccharibacteria bacterium]|nr:Dam family site-specific DNA-(adenine-N6)-methyltransferase [Candidatus Saccharibacteria bacterium]